MTDQTSSSTLQKAGSGRKVLIAIVAIPAVVLLLSTGLYYMVNTKAISLSTVNNGTLVSPPIRLTELSLKTPQGDDYDYSLPEPKWSFLVIAGRDCNRVCERML